MKRMKRQLVGCALATALLMPGAHALEAPLEQALAALPSYSFGSDRAPISALEVAVTTAGADLARRAELTQGLAAILGGAATADAHREALRLFSLVATDADIAPMLPLLASAEVGDTALWTLERIAGPGVDTALVGALGEVSPAQQAAIVRVIGRRRAADAVPALRGLTASEDVQVAEAALTALGMIGDQEAYGALSSARGAGVPDALKPAFADAWLRCAAHLEAAGSELAIAMYADFIGGGFPGHVRAGAVNGLIRLQPDKANDLILNAFKSDSPELVELALSHMRTQPGDAATAAFAALLPTVDPAKKVLLLRGLAERGDTAAAPAVLAETSSEDPAVSFAAIEALAKVGSEDALPFLLDTATDGPRETKQAARDSLTTLPGKGVDSGLLKAAQEGETARRVQALKALASRRATDTTKGVQALSEDKDTDVRTAALQTLRVLGGAKELDYLLGRLPKAEDDAERDRVAQTIVAIAQREGETGARSGAVLAALKSAKDATLRAALLSVLGRIGSADALDTLYAAAKEDDAAVRGAAVAALAGWPDAAPIDQLRVLCAADAPADTRAAAFAGYVRQLKEVKDLDPAARFARYEEAMNLAQETNERRAVLSGLPSAPVKGALDLAAKYRSDAELANEATAAELQLCAALAGAYPDDATARAKAILAGEASDAVKNQANAVIAAVGRFDGYLTAWQYAGPYAEEGKVATTLFDMSFPPETAPETVTWNLMPLANNAETPWAMSFAEVFGGFERVAYLRTQLDAEAAQDVILEVGSNDGCKVWFNGELIQGANIGRPLAPGEDKLPVSLKPGANSLMIAVYQHGGDWAACARLRTPDGQPVTGVKNTLP